MMAVPIGRIKTVNFSFVWEIENFSNLRTKISSPRYKNEDMEWILVLSPYGIPEGTNDYIGLHLISLNCFESKNNDLKIGVSFQISILNRLKQKVVSKQHKIGNSYVFYTKDDYSIGFNQYISRDDLLNKKDLYLFEDKLVILCEIFINPQIDSKYIIAREKCVELTDDLELMFLCKCFSDLTIMVDGKKLFVHKSILSARSKVFCAMLEHDMKENNESLVEITDTSYDVMKEVLRFIYCGRVENLEKLAISILPMADKYALSSLKMICEDVLWKILNIENACETLAIAETHNCNDLKSTIMKYIITNIKQVTLTSGFKELKNHQSHLLEEILCEIAQKHFVLYYN